MSDPSERQPAADPATADPATADPADADPAAADEPAPGGGANARRRAAVRRRILRRSTGGALTAAGAIGLAFGIALANGLAGRLLADPPPAPATQTPANEVPANEVPATQMPQPGHGFTGAIRYEYPAGQAFALPTPLVDSERAAALRLGFRDFTRDMTTFLRGHRGAAQSELIVTVTFTGTAEEPTRITGLRATRVTRTPNLAGTEIRTSSAGNHPTRNVTVDLDTSAYDVTQNGRPYFADNQIDITVRDREPFRITVTGTKFCYEWLLAVDFVGRDGRAKTSYFGPDATLYDSVDAVPADDVFRLTGPAASYGITYSNRGDPNGFRVVGPGED